MNITSNRSDEEGNGNDAPKQKQSVRLRGIGSEDQWPKSLIKGGGSRASRDATYPSNQFLSRFNTLSYLEGNWLFDCGATDTMSYDPNDFLTHNKPMKDIIKTANGEGIKVSRVRTISFTKNFTLKNCLFVPDLSHKLLSASQLIVT